MLSYFKRYRKWRKGVWYKIHGTWYRFPRFLNQTLPYEDWRPVLERWDD